MSLHLTTLTDNIAGGFSVLAEGGLSILVDTGTSKILFGTGKSITAANNAAALGVDLTQVDKIVLSHGHFDHTGGLRQVLSAMRKPVEVIAHPDIWTAKYSRPPKGPEQYVGIPYQQRELESLGATFTLTKQPLQVTPEIMTTGEVPTVTSFEDIEPILCVKEGADWKPDLFADDLSLAIKTELGLVVVLGCAHRGVINNIYQAQKVTGIKKVYMVLGGAHLLRASEERLWATIAALRELDVQRLGSAIAPGCRPSPPWRANLATGSSSIQRAVLSVCPEETGRIYPPACPCEPLQSELFEGLVFGEVNS